MLSNRSLVLFPAIILSLLTCLTAGASALQCRQALRSDVQTVKIEGRRFTFMAWNLKNVFTYQGKFEREDGMNNMRRAEGPEGAIRPKPMHEVRAVRDMLARQMPDFAVFTVNENVFSLRRLLEEYLRLQG